MTHRIKKELSLCHSLLRLDMVRFPVLRHIEPQSPLTVVVCVETIPLCQGHVFATRLQRPCSFPDTSGTRKIQKTASANDCFNVLDKCGFVFPRGKFSEQSCETPCTYGFSDHVELLLLRTHPLRHPSFIFFHSSFISSLNTMNFLVLFRSLSHSLIDGISCLSLYSRTATLNR